MNRHALFLLLLFLLAIGCRAKSVTQAPVSEEVSSSASVLMEEVHLTEAKVAEDSDPALEGWTSEAISNQASQQWNRLGELVLKGAANNGVSASSLVSSTFVCQPLVPSTLLLEQVLDDGMAMVQRMKSGDGATPSAIPLDDAVRALREVLSEYPDDQKFKFKLFRVTLDDDGVHFSTQQYVHFSGRADQRAREWNATWLADWEMSEGTVLLRSIRLASYEQVTLRQRSQFTDLTQTLLAKNASFAEALQPDIPHWRKHLEYSLGVYNFGHHGLAIGDADGDGRPDLFVCQTGGIPNHLYLQQPDGTLRDASAAAGLDYLDNTRSALFLDLDNDDDQDLVMALNSGLLFFENTGEARFRLRARIPSVRQAFSLTSADYDQDGLLDLYICVYYGDGDDVSELPVPVPYFDAKNGGANHLVRNAGNWKFEDVTEQTGLDEDNSRFSFAATWEDYDQDGDLDLFVVNDFGPNHLYRNTDGLFRNVAPEMGLVDGAFGMSASFGDYDRDGNMDLYVGNMFSAAGNRVTFQPQFKPRHDAQVKGHFQHLARGNSLFRNLGNGHFEDVSVAAGVTMGRWSWSSIFADINSDGWDDLLVANGFVTGDSKDDL